MGMSHLEAESHTERGNVIAKMDLEFRKHLSIMARLMPESSEHIQPRWIALEISGVCTHCTNNVQMAIHRVIRVEYSHLYGRVRALPP